METSEAKAAYEELTKKFGTGHSVGKNLTLEHWDKLYGDGHLDYSVYMLLDGRYAEITEINKYLEFILDTNDMISLLSRINVSQHRSHCERPKRARRIVERPE